MTVGGVSWGQTATPNAKRQTPNGQRPDCMVSLSRIPADWVLEEDKMGLLWSGRVRDSLGFSN